MLDAVPAPPPQQQLPFEQVGILLLRQPVVATCLHTAPNLAPFVFDMTLFAVVFQTQLLAPWDPMLCS